MKTQENVAKGKNKNMQQQDKAGKRDRIRSWTCFDEHWVLDTVSFLLQTLVRLVVAVVALIVKAGYEELIAVMGAELQS